MKTNPIIHLAPVCFSIKAKDDNPAAALPPALPQEPSDDEDASAETIVQKPINSLTLSAPAVHRHVPENVQKAIKLVESQLMARNAQLTGTLSAAPVSYSTMEVENKSLVGSKAPSTVTEVNSTEQLMLAKQKEQKLGMLLYQLCSVAYGF